MIAPLRERIDGPQVAQSTGGWWTHWLPSDRAQPRGGRGEPGADRYQAAGLVVGVTGGDAHRGLAVAAVDDGGHRAGEDTVYWCR